MIIDQLGRKRCQKKSKDVDYKLLQEFFQKYFVVHERSAVKNSFSNQYIRMLFPRLFILIESVARNPRERVRDARNISALTIEIFRKSRNHTQG